MIHSFPPFFTHVILPIQPTTNRRPFLSSSYPQRLRLSFPLTLTRSSDIEVISKDSFHLDFLHHRDGRLVERRDEGNQALVFSSSFSASPALGLRLQTVG